MVEVRIALNIFAYFLTFLFAVVLGAIANKGNTHPLEAFLFSVLLCCSLGLVLRKEWARKLILATSIVGIIYFLAKQLLILRAFDIPTTAMMGILGVVIYFYRGGAVGVFQGNLRNEGKKWTILVVDDDLTFVKLVKSHFIRRGVTVISSDSGERGLEMAKRWKPDLIILDVILPGMKGRSVCARLKEDSHTEKIPVMFVTFKNSLDDISAEMELGAVLHLTKPVNYDHLYEQVYKILMKG